MTRLPLIVPGACRLHGFSLIELIIAIAIFAVGAALTTQALIPAAQSIPVDTEVQLATQAAQACAEHLISLRALQTNGWDTIPPAANALCSSIPLPAGYTRTLGIVALANATNPPCIGTFTTAGSCREITITVGKVGGQVPAVSYKFTMVNY